ncbi:CpsB/CapC family capsule biosynthesis tyrosine phosphatase [Pedobacter sp. UYP30]|uniref:tyrosine-protein phosphatase n=1 Tax=Pedobacter sp. UYP30 TaxID=1756400 RepID=UPI003398E5A2
MLFFNRPRKDQPTDFSKVGLDMHSHLIPGVDDGAKDIADSILLINGLKNLGFEHLITTPHTLQDIHPNTQKTLGKGHLLLEGKLPEGLTFRLSSEYYLDEQFQGQLEAGAVMPLPGNRLLVEFSQITKPYDLEERFFDLSLKGYQPILAHPERYLFFHRHFEYYKRIKDMGVELQVNALSLTDHYGKSIRKIAEKLIEKDMIDFIGTDTHHLKHIETLAQVPQNKFFVRLLDSGLLKNQELM